MTIVNSCEELCAKSKNLLCAKLGQRISALRRDNKDLRDENERLRAQAEAARADDPRTYEQGAEEMRERAISAVWAHDPSGISAATLEQAIRALRIKE